MTDSTDRNEINEWQQQLNDDYFFVEELRDRAARNMRFVNIPGSMWEGADLQNFKKRIKLEFNRLSKEINVFIAESETNRKSPKFRAEDSKDDGTGRVLNGLFRKDFRKSSGINAYDNAVQELAFAGVGALRVSTERANPNDLEDDRQKVVFNELFESYKTVIWDSNSKKIDKSDAKYCNVLTSYTFQAFEDEFGVDAQKTGIGLPDQNQLFFKWFDRGERLIWISERYEIKTKKIKAIILDNESTGERKILLPADLEDIEDDLKEQGFRRTGKRQMLDTWVEKSTYSSTEILEEQRRIPGKLIPIIPFYCYRVIVNGREFVKSMVDEPKDSQRLINMVLSKYAEISSTTPKDVPIFTSEQMKGHQLQWSTQHHGMKPYALINPVKGPDGINVHLGPVGTLQPPVADQHSQLTLEFADRYIREESAGAPKEFSDPDASGVAIGKILDRQNMDTQPIFTNINRAVVRMGEVYRSIRTDIALPNETVALVSEDNKDSSAIINETVLDEETGNLKVINNLAQGDFETIVDVGESYASLRKETVVTLTALLEKTSVLPAGEQYNDFILSSIIQNIDGAGLDPLQKFNRDKMLLSGFVEPETPEEEQFLQEAQQAQEEQQVDPMQEAQQRLFLATADNEVAKAAESQAKSVEIQTKAQLNQANVAKVEAETKETLAGIGLGFRKLQSDQNQNVLKLGVERQKLRQQGQQQLASIAQQRN